MTLGRHRVDVIVPTFNGRELLDECLRALRRQQFADFSVTVVDDGSTDGTAEFIRTRYPEVQVVRLAGNGGLARACNAGIAVTNSPLVALLNNDTEPEPGWLQALVEALDAAPAAGSAATKLLLYDRRDTLHSAGDCVAIDGMPLNRGVWQPDTGQFDAATTVFGPCAGAALYRRCMLDAVSDRYGAPFDEDLFMYCEDVDLNWRARRAGYESTYVPRARVYHRLSATGAGRLASYYTARNTILVIAQNFPGTLFRRYWRQIVRAQLARARDALIHWRGEAARATLRGMAAGALLAPWFVRKRRARRWQEEELRRVDALLVRPPR